MKKVLVVDDDKSIQMLYAEELTEEGYDVITCGDGSRLMQLIEKESPTSLCWILDWARMTDLISSRISETRTIISRSFCVQPILPINMI